MAVEKIKCYTCRDKGLKGGCPDCRKVLGKIDVWKIRNPEGIVDAEKVKLSIPTYYIGREWDVNELKLHHKEMDGDNQFDKYCDQLSKIHNIFVNGSVPNKSAIIIAPKQFSKKIWAYSCIQFGIQSGYKMLPVLSSQLTHRTLTMFTESTKSKLLDMIGYSLGDILTADCLFVTIDSGFNVGESYKIIDELMSLRANMDRSTIFISKFSIPEMTRYDDKKSFKPFIDSDSDLNRLMYPIVIQVNGKG